jgi:sugar phosphate isomerase/epimerase
MPTVPLEEAIPLLARLGYDGIEFCIGPEPFDTLPDQIDSGRRKRLRELLAQNRLGVPALMNIRRSVLAKDDETHRENLEHLRKTVQLARDLGVEDAPVMSMGFGGKRDLWEGQRDQLVSRLRDYAQVASEQDFMLAGEAHCGAAVDRTERALWVIQAVNHARVRLHFDIAHFFLADEAIADSVEALLPITVHTHVTDAHKHPDGGFDFRLLGEGDLDLVSYIKAMHAGGWTDFITVEVSTRVWAKEGYDPYDAAASCYRTLVQALDGAGVPHL